MADADSLRTAEDESLADKMGLPRPTTLEEAIRQRDAWVDSACMFSRGQDYYRGLLDQIGETLGDDALIADDGSRPGGILRAKLPELVAVLARRKDRPVADESSSAWRDVLAERRRQVEAEGWTTEHDDGHSQGEMARAAGTYAINAGRTNDHWSSHVERFWPWSLDWWKPTDRRRDLVKAAALLLAEIERLDRKADPSL